MQSWIDWLNSPLLTALSGTLSIAEVFGFATGLLAVWLTARSSVWNFPIGIANNALLLLLFFEGHLFADASLQIMFIVLGILGWWFWSGVAARVPLVVRSASATERVWILLSTIVLTAASYAILTQVKGSVPIFDALITAISIVAQWLLNRKVLDNWTLWIVADVISIPVYLFKHLYLIALLFAFFLILAGRGYQLWRRQLAMSLPPAERRSALVAE